MPWSSSSRIAAARRARAQGWVVGPRGQPVFAATGRRHGTRSMYVSGCRCDDCRRANTAYREPSRGPAPTPDPTLVPIASADLDLSDIIRDGDAFIADMVAVGDAAYRSLSPADRALVDAFDPSLASIGAVMRALS